MTHPPDRAALGLRERKKAKTRAAIRDHAMRLFREQGYAETTVDQIADAAEVSPSTFFRYFRTKEDVVLQHEFDSLLVAAIREQPASLPPIGAVRAALRAVFGGLPPEVLAGERERHELIKAVPELRAAVLDSYTRSLRLLAEVIAERLDREPTDFAVRVFSGALIGVAVAAADAGDAVAPLPDYVALVDRAFALLEAGLPL